VTDNLQHSIIQDSTLVQADPSFVSNSQYFLKVRNKHTQTMLQWHVK